MLVTDGIYMSKYACGVPSRFDIENNVMMWESGGIHVESGFIYPHPKDKRKSRKARSADAVTRATEYCTAARCAISRKTV